MTSPKVGGLIDLAIPKRPKQLKLSGMRAELSSTSRWKRPSAQGDCRQSQRAAEHIWRATINLATADDC